MNLAAPGCWIPITPSDSVLLTSQFRGLYVGSSGNLTVDCGYGPFTIAVVAGSILPILGVRRVLLTNTTSTGICGIQ